MLNPFGCRHKRIGWPVRVRLRNGQISGIATCLCLDCGQRLVYDEHEMKTGEVVHGCRSPGLRFVITREETAE
jgi:hypothetical protein